VPTFPQNKLVDTCISFLRGPGLLLPVSPPVLPMTRPSGGPLVLSRRLGPFFRRCTYALCLLSWCFAGHSSFLPLRRGPLASRVFSFLLSVCWSGATAFRLMPPQDNGYVRVFWVFITVPPFEQRCTWQQVFPPPRTCRAVRGFLGVYESPPSSPGECCALGLSSTLQCWFSGGTFRIVRPFQTFCSVFLEHPLELIAPSISGCGLLLFPFFFHKSFLF